MPDQLLMSDRVPIANTLEYNYVKDTATITEYFHLLFEKVLSGEIKVNDLAPISSFDQFPYDYNSGNYKQISNEDIYKTLEIDDKTIDIPLEDIKSVSFIEEWILDEDKFCMYKDVKALTPVIHYYYYYGESNGDSIEVMIPPFTFIYDVTKKDQKRDNATKNKILLSEITYRFIIHNKENWPPKHSFQDIKSMKYTEKFSCPFWSSYSRQKLVYTIFDQVLSGKSSAYDYHNNMELDTMEIRNRMDAGIRSYTIIDPETGYEIKKTELPDPDLDEIQSVIFIEEWYYDEKTLELGKKLKGVAPIRSYFPDGDGPFEERIVFVTYFNEP